MVEVVDVRDVVSNLAHLNDVDLSGGINAPAVLHRGRIGSLDYIRKQFSEEIAEKIYQNTILELQQAAKHYAQVWGTSSNASASELETIDLPTLLRLYNMPCVVDMLDVDIQGVEFNSGVLMDQLELLTQRFRRVFIGTHGNNEPNNSRVMIERFKEHGWVLEHYIPLGVSKHNDTGLGPLYCEDGVISLFNPHTLPLTPCNQSLPVL
eukprot:gnl/TRDRNA2_/TRDRNA2_166454_c1_seq1.p1 gnl/TRDRNA2_/TRDRNA2_166454_c1~~gnl/TRDRNA2_/TRDRNA2_166454_c1_seq1.p1  ORF type:complete len:219 (-),score=23.58 gnl/TRDRNA2_/TRDRNA2_166454_c1_seq1:20-643(-)